MLAKYPRGVYDQRQMKTILTLTCALALAAPAQAYTHRMHVPARTDRAWETPRGYTKTDPVIVRVWVNGREIQGGASYKSACRLVWGWPKVLVQATVDCQGRSPIEFHVWNERGRKVNVRFKWWVEPRQDGTREFH